MQKPFMLFCIFTFKLLLSSHFIRANVLSTSHNNSSRLFFFLIEKIIKRKQRIIRACKSFFLFYYTLYNSFQSEISFVTGKSVSYISYSTRKKSFGISQLILIIEIHRSSFLLILF